MEGPCVGREGVVKRMYSERGIVLVIITIFGRATPVELEQWQTEKI